MIGFLFSRVFWVNVLLAIIFVALLIFVVFYYLDTYTRHGDVVSVPNVNGFEISEVGPLFENKGLRFTIVDSVYFPDVKGGVVVEQDPSGEELVKKNRQVYLTMSSFSPPSVTMPHLVDLTLPLAMAKLASADLNVGELHYKPSDCVNCILGMEVKGKPMKAGTHLPKGSVVSLIVGQGASAEQVAVPYLIGLTTNEAAILLAETGLNMGAAPCADCVTERDSTIALVYRQDPPANGLQMVSLGSTVSIFLSVDPARVEAAKTETEPIESTP